MMKIIGPQDALVKAGTTALSDDDLFDFLSKTENATFGFFRKKSRELRSFS